MRIGDFVPPIAGRLYGRLRGTRAPRRQLYSSFSDAMRECGKGYSEEELARVVFEKTKAFKRGLDGEGPLEVSATDAYGLLALAHAMSRAEPARREYTVVDLGGACGAHYFVFKKFAGDDLRFRWFVVETEVMCRLAEPFQNDELKFLPDLGAALGAAGTPDLLHVSGVLQFVERPYDMLGRLVESGARYLLLNRLGLTAKSDDLVTVHRSMLSANGRGPLPTGFADREVAYPCVFLSEKKLAPYLSGYETVVEFDDKTGFSSFDDEPTYARGLLLRRRSAGASRGAI